MRIPAWFLGIARLIRLQNAMMVLCAVLVSAYGASMYASIHRAYQQAMTDAGATLQSIARSSEVGTNRTIFAIDSALLGVERMLETLLPQAPLDDSAVKMVLNQLDDQTLVVRDILILDTHGRLLNKAGLATEPEQDYANRQFFTVHQNGGAPSLYVGLPRRSRTTGEWSVMMSRPLMRHEQTIGVIAAEVPVSIFADLYGSLVVNSGVAVRLLTDDGRIMASEPSANDQIGRKLPDAAALLAAVASRRYGVIGDLASDTGHNEVIGFADLGARPLIVVASRRRTDILEQWRNESVGSVVAFMLFAVTAACLTWLMVRAVDRQQKATARLRDSEEQLHRQSDLLQSTLENMGEGLSVFASDGRLVAWNARFVELLSLSPDMTTNTNLRDILMMQAQRGDFGSVDPAVEVAQRLERFFSEIPIVRERLTHGGRTLQIRRRAMPGGAVVTLYSDITERKAAETKMAHAWAQAELANRSKTEFLANMSHELRTPLNAIIGFSEILAHEHLGPIKNERYLEYANDIHASGQHLLSIINDVLDMSKIEAGKLDLHEGEIDVGALVCGSVRMVRDRARAQGIELVCKIADQNHVVVGDERALKQCLLNVLSNAIKFSPKGGTVTVESLVEPDGGCLLVVEDQGIGMTEEELERALQPFGQAQASTSRAYGGTGLGLPITQGLVEAHGGALSIVTAPDKGTRVSMRLPPDRTRSEGDRPLALRA